MLVFPQLLPEIRDGCRVPRWMPAERFAPYFARPTVLTYTKQVRFYYKNPPFEWGIFNVK